MAFELQRLPETEEELFWVVKAMWGVTIPRQVVCPDHVAPMTAFADAYFERNSLDPDSPVQDMALWHGSRGLSGKSYMLAVLGLTKAVLLGSDVNLLGGSFEQSKNIHIHMRNSWAWEQAPKYMVAKDGATEVKLTNKATIRPLTASQNTVRGPHPPFLLLDEIDEMDIEILDAALGQPMPQKNYLGVINEPFTVLCLAGSSRVLTPAGEVALDSIQVGTLVMTRQGWRPVKNVWRNGFREVIDLELSNGRVLRCTPDHRIATPGGWLEAGTLAVGQEVCGIRTNFVVSKDGLGEQPLGLSTPVVLSGLLPMGDPLASLTDPPTTLGQPSVLDSELVPLGAMSLQGIDDARSCAAVQVGDRRDSFQVSRVATSLAGTASGLDVIDFVPNRDFVDQTLVGPDMHPATVDGAVHAPVPLSLSSIPDPTAGFIDGAPAQEPVFIVGVGTGLAGHTLVPVYDLEVDDIHEYVAEGITVSNCSTWQHPNGTFTTIKQRAEEKGYPIYTWCFLETSNPIDGWLSQKTIDGKKAAIPKEMWRVEYELNEPSIGNRAFDSASIERAFSLPFEPEYDEAGDPIPGTGYLYKREGKDYEEYRFEKYERDGRYVAGADWAQTQDYTVISVGRIDVKPFRLVYYARFNRLPYPVMVKKFEDAIEEYEAFAEHDGTGLGAVVHDLLEHERARSFKMQGEKRSSMLSEYVAAVENDRWVFPKIKSAYTEHKYAQVGDLYSSKEEFHLPDSVCAFGLMEHVAKRFVGPVIPLNVTKNPEFQNRIQKVLDRPLDRVAEVEIKDADAPGSYTLLV